MARGWESKSVEAQIDAAEVYRHRALIQNAPPAHELETIRRKESIVLSRVRVVRELQNAQNPRYKTVLTKALADLDAQLGAFASD